MAWTPIPHPVPDEDATLAHLLQEPGEPATGYITADDLQSVVNTLLSRLYYLEQNTTSWQPLTLGSGMSPMIEPDVKAVMIGPIVHFCGAIAIAAETLVSGQELLQLPAEFTPTNMRLVSSVGGLAGGAPGPDRPLLLVQTNGQVVSGDDYPQVGATLSWVSLDGVSFAVTTT